MLLVVAATEPELRAARELDGVELLVCGVGPIDAAASVAARLATEPRPDAVLHVGIAGARRDSPHEIGTTVIGDRSLYCDTQSRLVASTIEPDRAMLAAACGVLPDAAIATIGTSGDVGGSSNCGVEGMEGFAVLRAAALAGIPAIEVRTISNEIEESDRALWRFDLALDAVAAALPQLVVALR